MRRARGGAGRTAKRTGAALAALVGGTLLLPVAVEAQVGWDDLVFTLGGAVEGYRGNLTTATVLPVDSTDRATAAVGEAGVRGTLVLHQQDERTLDLAFDAGFRQAAAVGFSLRDYAPREWVGSASLRVNEGLGQWGRLIGRAGFRGRSVVDRPPIPMFLQPGYRVLHGDFGLVTRAFGGMSLDARVEGETSDYRALEFLPQLDLLDRRAVGVRGGVRWGDVSTMRVYGGLRWVEYRNQPSFIADDPFRRDRTLNLGLEWVGDWGEIVFVQAGLHGTLNRSNSNRPEYDALSFDGLFQTALPAQVSLALRVAVTGKSYLQSPEFALLLPGEEADNASIAYLEVTRSLADNLDGSLRFGWTRAETDVGAAYYRRYGGSVRFNFRPRGY